MVAKKKVLQVLEAAEGGALRHVLQVVDCLDREGYAVTLAISEKRGKVAHHAIEVLEAKGIGVVRVPMQRGIRPWSDLKCYVQLRRLMRLEGYGVVHVHSSKAGFLGRLAARGLGAKVIYTPHCFYFLSKRGLVRRVFIGLERLVAPFTDVLVAVSESERKLTLDLGLLEEGKVKLVRNGVDTGVFYPPTPGKKEKKSPFVVGMVGRLSPQKGWWEALKVMKLLVARGQKDVQFWVVGSGELEAGLRAYVERNGLDDHVVFWGQVDGVAAVLRRMDAVLSLSHWESMPYAVIEAMASGLPVVASGITPLAELVEDGVEGFLVG